MNQYTIQVTKTTIITEVTTITLVSNKYKVPDILQQLNFSSYRHNRQEGMQPEALKAIGFPDVDVYEEVYQLTLDH